MRPNRITGMKMHGIGRACNNKHYKKLYRKWRIYEALQKKYAREEAHRGINGNNARTS